MTIEEQLKEEILRQYKSVRAFTTQNEIPYSTLDSVFKRGIENAGLGKMLKVFDSLGLDIESIQTGVLAKKEKNPAQPDGSAREGKTAIQMADSLRELFVSYGYVGPDEDLSDEDLRFVTSLISLIDSWFQQHS